jgi:hypothetical protein
MQRWVLYVLCGLCAACMRGLRVTAGPPRSACLQPNNGKAGSECVCRPWLLSHQDVYF